MAELTANLGLKKCSECKEMNKALDIYRKFRWEYICKIIDYDKTNNEIIIDEKALMDIIRQVNPVQKERKIRLGKVEQL